ncbi:MAG TPA: hypothetical protein VKS25_04020 [Solirubrobacteraceae bacterium]|nr:hypothetical protein [Solirubrobacteraceae bacterium]
MSTDPQGQPGAAGTTDSPPFRFYDNRQKYLTFVNTCNEKAVIVKRAAMELAHVQPSPPALRLFDAGMGDATVLSRMMRTSHQLFPTVPLLAVAKEISLEDVRLGLEKMPDRFYEHGNTVLVITNLSYADAPGLSLADPSKGPINWQVIRLEGSSSNEFGNQIEALEPSLAHGWETKPNAQTGNPTYVRPSVLVVYRADHEFVLDSVIPHEGAGTGGYDFVLASQPWRARTSAKFKAEKILAPLSRSLKQGGRLLVVQSAGHDAATEVVEQLWPGEDFFPVHRGALLEALAGALGDEAAGYDLANPTDDGALFRYEMHTLPSEIADRIGTSTLFAAWNAVIYVNQIEDERLDEVVASGAYLSATQQALHDHGGLWFNDEAFVVTRR